MIWSERSPWKKTTGIPEARIAPATFSARSRKSPRATNFATLAVPRALDDASGYAADVPTLGLLADYYPPETRGKAFAVLGTLVRAARPVAPILTGAIASFVADTPATGTAQFYVTIGSSGLLPHSPHDPR